jgi:hypothetical protein
VRRIAPQQYCIAVQQRQAIILMGIAATHSERRCPEGPELSQISQSLPGNSAFPKCGSARDAAQLDQGIGSILQREKSAARGGVDFGAAIAAAQ